MRESVVVAEVVRSGVVEGVHRGHAVIVDADGQVVRSWGDPHTLILPRSANKIAQASAMVRNGLPLRDELLALAAASHSGEPFHVEGVLRILDGIPVGALRTPPDWPWDEVDRCALRAAGDGPSPLFMNCSGKHAAMLLTSAINDWPLDTYLQPEHPLQEAIVAQVELMAGERVWASAVDGCGAPLLGLSLSGLARTATHAVQAAPQTPERMVADAMRAHPEWVAGTRREAAVLAAGVPGLLLKEGAEGVYVAALSDGTGVAVKIDDGAARARQVVMAEILARLGVASDVVAEHREQPLFGGGAQVGQVRASLG